MRLRAALVLAAALGALGLTASATTAAVADSYCSPSGDYCTSVKIKQGEATLQIGTFSFSGGYTLCVEPPDGRESCKKFDLKSDDGIFGDEVKLARHFPAGGAGTYVATWKKFGGPLGKSLKFRLR